jgi:hypothetical protein
MKQGITIKKVVGLDFTCEADRSIKRWIDLKGLERLELHSNFVTTRLAKVLGKVKVTIKGY